MIFYCPLFFLISFYPCVFHRYVLLSPEAVDETPPVITLLIKAPSEHVGDELKLVVFSALAVLKSSIEDTKVFPGGGCFEIMLAAHLRRRSQIYVEKLKMQDSTAQRTTSNDHFSTGTDIETLRFQRIYRAVADVSDCLEECAAALPQKERMQSKYNQSTWKNQILANNKKSLQFQLQQGLKKPSSFYGFHCNHTNSQVVFSVRTGDQQRKVDNCSYSAKPCDCGLSSHAIFDSAFNKRCAIQASFEAASAALRISLSVRASGSS